MSGGLGLGLGLVVEGAEDQETVDGLRALGCAVVQGHHLSRPLPAEQVLDRVARREAAVPAQRDPQAVAQYA